MPRYVALLRGINVGGANLIRMTDLARCCTSLGLDDVRTYIASGNVLFTSTVTRTASLETRLEDAFSKAFRYSARVVVVPRDTMRRVVGKAPAGFGTKPKQFRYDVIFFRGPGRADDAIASIATRDGVDRLWCANGVVYSERLIARASQSRLSRITQHPDYKYMTIRNWNTTTRLLELMETTSPA